MGFNSEVSYQKQFGKTNPSQSSLGKLSVKCQEEQMQGPLVRLEFRVVRIRVGGEQAILAIRYYCVKAYGICSFLFCLGVHNAWVYQTCLKDSRQVGRFT